MAARFDLDAAGCAKIGIEPCFYRCYFKVDFKVFQSDGVTPRDLTGAKFRFVLMEGEFDPTVAYDFERVEGQSGDAHVVWLDPQNGVVRVELGTADSSAVPKLGRWYNGMFVFLGGSPRGVTYYGRFDVLNAPSPTTAVDPDL